MILIQEHQQEEEEPEDVVGDMVVVVGAGTRGSTIILTSATSVGKNNHMKATMW